MPHCGEPLLLSNVVCSRLAWGRRMQFAQLKRRDFITLVGGAAAWPLAARAQQPERMRRIGVLMLYPESDPQGQLRATAFRQGLEKLDWTVGRNVQIDFQWGLGDTDWIRSAAAQLLQLAPDVILANGDAATRVVQQSTRTVPIIFIAGQRPGRGRLGAEPSPTRQKSDRVPGFGTELGSEIARAAQGDRAERCPHCDFV
jgi:hypothetical protein